LVKKNRKNPDGERPALFAIGELLNRDIDKFILLFEFGDRYHGFWNVCVSRSGGVEGSGRVYSRK